MGKGVVQRAPDLGVSALGLGSAEVASMNKSIVPSNPYEMITVSKRRAILFRVLLAAAGACVLAQWLVVNSTFKLVFTVAFVVFLVAAVAVLGRRGRIGTVIH